ncbi:hypothetical protein SA496_21345 [Pseudomonas sp. JS3066]|uniref:hypothetical protein n=1 Tax=Pseudomonas sp. JS3066 TaxID=3090665 RepID=UPI002E7B65B2|nr:hypothetical protein [Pseudomonas sp. JS3066]WVK92247.1 hypothetical protein SA496_21345 [Pseudomonas sp. JS3066]
MAQGSRQRLQYLKDVVKVLFFIFALINFFTSSIAVVGDLWNGIDSVVWAVAAVSGYILFVPVLTIILIVRGLGFKWD